jgi:transcriptional regulator NrdR family protein
MTRRKPKESDYMKCPVCGTRYFQCLETRQSDGKVHRIRECFNGHKFKTTEQVNETAG